MRFLLKTPAIAGVVTGSIKSRLIKKAKAQGASLIEIRLDTFDKRDVLQLRQEIEAVRALDLRVLLTIRSKKEGGKLTITPKERLTLFTELITAVDMVDIELSSGPFAKEIAALAHKKKKKTIVSFHNFKATPSEARLEKIIKEARTIGADIVKIAAFATKKEDVRRLARTLLAHNDLIVIAMGAVGQSSRVTFPLLGSLVTYGSISESTAPGQMPIKELSRLLAVLD
ncbi:3-dehydroquinate dehydratase I [hydrothermal vent metagenome]|uniref:3-dehydroquinate dehydratase n=1 Tax=hydrothermal vent metagenome TaxID=652676 RepID=A0A3B0QKZ4_9ZZZZ